MRVTKVLRRILAILFMSGVGVAGATDTQNADSEANSEFTANRRRRPIVERPVEPPAPGKKRRPVVCVVDIETTGFVPARAAIIEVAAVRRTMRGETREIERFSELVRPAGNIPKAVRDLTGITNEMVKTARTIDEVLPDFLEFVGDAPVIAYSASFDQRFLEYHGRAQGATLSNNEWICALKMARRSPLTGPFALGNVAEKLGIQSSKGHRASADCEVTLEIYERLYEMLEGDITILPPRKAPRGATEDDSQVRRGPERPGIRVLRVPRRGPRGTDRKRRRPCRRRDLTKGDDTTRGR